MTTSTMRSRSEEAEYAAPERAFDLPAEDMEHLDARGLRWETVREGQGHWLLLHGFPVPHGYNVASVTLALMIPSSYPSAELDMFWVHPVLTLNSSRTLPQTQSRAMIRGLSFQRWSRHRSAENPWRSGIDSLATHLGIVEECLARETSGG